MATRTDYDRIQRDRQAASRSRKFINELDPDEYNTTFAAARPLADRLTERQLLADRMQSELRGGGDLVAAFTRQEIDGIDGDIRRDFPTVSPTLRALSTGQHNMGRHSADFDLNVRALGATDRASTGDVFGSSAWPALVGSVPILGLCTVIETGLNGSPYEYSVGSVPAANLVAEGGTITATDVVHSMVSLGAFKYVTLLQMSMQLAEDGVFPYEQFVIDRLGRPGGGVYADLGTDLTVGDGSGKPTSYYAGVTTVAAAGATTVVLDDIGKLCEDLPSQYLNDATILLSPGAYFDLRREQLGGTATGDGGLAVDASTDGISGRLMGIPFKLDPALTAPTTATVTAVIGAFKASYVARLTSLKVETDDRAALGTDQRMIRVSLRADGNVQLPDAARALVMA